MLTSFLYDPWLTALYKYFIWLWVRVNVYLFSTCTRKYQLSSISSQHLLCFFCLTNLFQLGMVNYFYILLLFCSINMVIKVAIESSYVIAISSTFPAFLTWCLVLVAPPGLSWPHLGLALGSLSGSAQLNTKLGPQLQGLLHHWAISSGLAMEIPQYCFKLTNCQTGKHPKLSWYQMGIAISGWVQNAPSCCAPVMWWQQFVLTRWYACSSCAIPIWSLRPVCPVYRFSTVIS